MSTISVSKTTPFVAQADLAPFGVEREDDRRG